jgi:hypothetical protein
MQDSRIEGSVGANLDVKEGFASLTTCALVEGASSGLVLQGKARCLAIDTRIEGNKQGNVFAVPGARLVAMRCGIRGEASGLWLHDAASTVLESDLASSGAAAVDVRGNQVALFLKSKVHGEIVLAEGTTARFADCALEGKRTMGEGATLELAEESDVREAIQRAVESVQAGGSDGPES